MNTTAVVCIGCLNVDRKLTLLNEEYRQMLCELLEDTDNIKSTSACFECHALIKHVKKFKKQVKEANDYLCSYLIHNKTPRTLSNLRSRNVLQLDIYNDVKSKDRNNVTLQIKGDGDAEDFDSGCKTIKYEELNHNSSFEQDSSIFDQEPGGLDQESGRLDQESRNLDQISQRFTSSCTEPLAFVKMEESSFQEMDYDQYNEADGEEMKVQVAGALSDSDDEPLKMKSKKYKNRRKRKEARSKRERAPPSGVVSDPRVDKKLRDLNVEAGQIALVLLTWEEVQEERHLASQSVTFTRHAHRCVPCVLGYNHRHKLTQHNAKHSLEAGDEVCDVCTIRCKTKAALASHKRRHRARWVCLTCGARYSRACVAADHCARAHAAAAPRHACARCPHVATSLGALRMHVKSHSSRPECALCGKSFRDKSSLRTHAFVHRGEKEHACTVCDKRFMFKKQREIHELTHLSHQHLYCHQCDVSFKNQTSFYQHMKYSLKHIDPADIKHACQLCDKRFVKAKRLEEHNLAVHLKLAPIKCTVPDCTFACPSGAALRSHRRLVHGGARALRNHVCHECGNTYKTTQDAT